MPKSADGAILVPSVFLNKAFLSLFKDGQILLVNLAFLNKDTRTASFMDDTDLLFFLMISSKWLFFCNSLLSNSSALSEYYSFLLWMLLIFSTALW